MRFIVLLVMFGLVTMVEAQKVHTINMTTGKIKISELNAVTIEGHSGANVTIEVKTFNQEENERAAGLKLISPAGLTDNTGIGLFTGKEGEVTVIKPVSLRSDHRYTIKVPKSVSVYYEHTTHEGDDLLIKNVTGEIEVSARFNSVKFENISGPVAINTVHGEITGMFNALDQTHSISLTSVHGHVDVTVPASAKADFHLSSDWGEMYTDLDLAFDQPEGMKTLSKKKVDAKFNGGGVDFSIKSNHSDIYLRKK
jgi:hypothetical protein